MLLLLAFRNLFRNFRRTIAALCTIAVGAGALFSFDGFISGVLNEYRETTIHAHYGFGQIHTDGYRDRAFEDPTTHWIRNGGQLEEFLWSLDGVENVFPRVSFSALLKNENTTVSGLGQGIVGEREEAFFSSLNIEEGEALVNQPRGILLGRGLANALQVHPGDTVQVMATSTSGYISKDKFVVTGIFHTGSVDFDSRIFRIQLGEAKRLLKTPNTELISLALTNLSDWDRIAQAVEAEFPELQATPFDTLDEVYYKHSVDWLNAQFRVVQVIILGIVLLGIFNTISTSILERKQEIGNLRANGESISQILTLIVTEGALLGILGSCLGMALSAILLLLFVDKGLLMPPGPGMTRQFVVTFYFSWPMIGTTLLLSSSAALLASILAGIRVAKMSIAKSLRSY